LLTAHGSQAKGIGREAADKILTEALWVALPWFKRRMRSVRRGRALADANDGVMPVKNGVQYSE
jgi:hypothetical protein